MGKLVLETQKEIRELAYVIASLSLADKQVFLKEFFNSIDNEKEREKLIEYIFRCVYKNSWQKINNRMESYFVKDPTLKPVTVARMIRHYLKIKPALFPLLVKLAQKAKDRVRKRKFQKKDKKNTKKKNRNSICQNNTL